MSCVIHCGAVGGVQTSLCGSLYVTLGCCWLMAWAESQRGAPPAALPVRQRDWQGLGEGLEMRKWLQAVISRGGGNGS